MTQFHLKEDTVERKSAFTRTLEYFQTADYREAKACHDAAYSVLGEREPKVTPPEPKPRRTRRSKVNGEAATDEPLASA